MIADIVKLSMYKKGTIYLFKLTLMLFIFAISSACDFPKKEAVAREFLSEHPMYQIVSVEVGEGDSDAAYYHITYNMPNDDTSYEDTCMYLRDNASGDVKKHSCWHSDFKEKQ